MIALIVDVAAESVLEMSLQIAISQPNDGQ